MNKLLIFVLSIFCVQPITRQKAAVDFTQLINKTHTERSILLVSFYREEIGRLDSIAVFSLAQELDRWADSNNDAELFWEAQLMRAHYYYFTPRPSKWAFSQLNRLAILDGPIWFNARMEHLLGYYCMSVLNEFELGLAHYTRSADLLEHEDGALYPYKQKFLYSIGTHLCNFSDHDNALIYLSKALTSKVLEIPGFDYRIHISNSLGYSFRKLNVLDSSDHYFWSAYRLSKMAGDDVWEGIASGNIGENLYLRGELDAAIPYLRKDISSALSVSDVGLASNALTILGDIRLRKGELAASRQLLDSALSFAHRSGQYKRLAVLYPRMAKLYAAEKNVQLAQQFIDSTLFVHDSLERSANHFRVTRAQQKVRLEEVRASAQEQEFLLAGELRKRNNTTLVVFLIALIVTLFLNQRRLKAKLGQQLADEKRMEAERHLQDAQRKLDGFVEAVREMHHKDKKEADNNLDIDNLERSVLLTQRQWREFVVLFEKVHPEFFMRLQEKLPALTTAEIRFMALSRMRLGTKEMAAMLAISTDAVRQTRSRLTRKLALEKSLEQFALEV